MNYFRLLFISILILMGCHDPEKKSDPVERNKQEVVSRGPENGSLLIIGGGVNDMIWDKLKELMGGPDQLLVVIPTAVSSDTLSQNFLDEFKNSFVEKGFTNVAVLHTRDREEANSETFTKILQSASGVWFSGGRQWRHADSYLNTRTHEACNDVLKRGGVIAGNSAGATIQGSYLARGDTGANTIMMGDHEKGLGFLENVAIDQHLLARNRQFDIFEILEHRPELLGIGIDEKNTAIIVQKNRFSVIGESYVAVYDGTRWSAERDTIYQLPEGSREFYMLKAGDEYDLHKRKIIAFEDREFIKLSEDQMARYTGTYQLGGDSRRSEIYVQHDTLKITLWNDTGFALLSETETRFFIDQANILIEFKIGNDQEVTGFSLPYIRENWEKLED
jgi:cyanophycinase